MEDILKKFKQVISKFSVIKLTIAKISIENFNERSKDAAEKGREFKLLPNEFAVLQRLHKQIFPNAAFPEAPHEATPQQKTQTKERFKQEKPTFSQRPK